MAGSLPLYDQGRNNGKVEPSVTRTAIAAKCKQSSRHIGHALYFNQPSHAVKTITSPHPHHLATSDRPVLLLLVRLSMCGFRGGSWSFLPGNDSRLLGTGLLPALLHLVVGEQLVDVDSVAEMQAT
jgi:hypothetical protein